MFITEVTANVSGKIAFKLISANFLREKYMHKINAKEIKPKQSQWSQNCWKSCQFVLWFQLEILTRKLEFEKWVKIPHHGQNLIL